MFDLGSKADNNVATLENNNWKIGLQFGRYQPIQVVFISMLELILTMFEWKY